MDEEIEKLWEEYVQLAHAMQSGVGFDLGRGIDVAGANPKHLRVGINSAMVQNSALANLLINKGVITHVEYFTALRDGMKQEVEKYQNLLGEHYGTKVSLS